MLSIRRWYVYLVSGISLQSVTWALIFLLRFLFVPSRHPSTLEQAFFIAVIIIGLPIFLAHWLWAQRLASNDVEEKRATLRRIYLYSMMVAFLIPMIANVDGLIGSLLRLVFDIDPPRAFYSSLVPQHDLLNAGIAIVVLGLLWFYHNRIKSIEARQNPDVGELATVRRLYVYTFAAGGLIMTIAASMNLLLWIMFKVFGEIGDHGPGSELFILEEIARLAVGLPLWLVFWAWAQKLFTGDLEEERQSALRKLYLYVTVFLSALYAMFMLAMTLSDVFRVLMGIPSMGDSGQIRGPIAAIVVMIAVWAYHTFIIRQDMVAAEEGPRQAQIRRLYYYLMAGIGLAAFLVGLAGVVSVVIDGISAGRFSLDLKDQVAWFLAALIIGVPVWLIPWKQSQNIAARDDAVGESERPTIVRKIYLYLFLFVAAMTTLGFAVYIVAQIVDLALGGREATSLVSDLAQAISITLIAILVWLYHSFVIRSDGHLDEVEEGRRLASLKVTILDVGDGRFGRALIDELAAKLPELAVQPLGLTEEAAEVMGMDLHEVDPLDSIANSDVIVGPWNSITSDAGNFDRNVDIQSAINTSTARKLMIPLWEDGYLWAGVDKWDSKELVQQTVHALKQLAAGDDLKPSRPLGAATVVLIVAGMLILAGIVTSIIVSIFSSF
jgi:hypothetical protein